MRAPSITSKVLFWFFFQFLFLSCVIQFFFNHLIFFSGRISIANLCPKELEKKIMDFFCTPVSWTKKKNWEDLNFFVKLNLKKKEEGWFFSLVYNTLLHSFFKHLLTKHRIRLIFGLQVWFFLLRYHHHWFWEELAEKNN